MRITFVLPEDNLSGGQRVVATYAQRLRTQGHTVVLVAAGPRRRTLVRQAKDFLRRRPAQATGLIDGSHYTGLDLDYRVRKNDAPVTDAEVPDADAVVATWWKTAPPTATLSSRKGAKAYFIQGYEATIPGQPPDQVDATWRLPMQKIVVAQWLADLAREKFGDDSARVVPNSVDTTKFNAPARGKNPIPTVGFVYAPTSIKGSDIAIAALSALKQQLPALRVVAFGAEPPTADFPLPSWMELTVLPPQPRIREMYASCDVWVLASRIEGFGLPMLEAMACRTPVVASAAGAAPEVLALGGGLLVERENPPALAAAIGKVLALDEESWRALSAQAQAIVSAYSWEDAARKFADALSVAVERGCPQPAGAIRFGTERV